MRLNILATVIAGLCATVLLPADGHAAADKKTSVEKTVAQIIQPLMRRYQIPGMAVGIIVGGKSTVHNYGVASKTTDKRVTDSTLFEIGSISKTFTATLTAYAQVTGHLSLSDSASKYLPALRGSSFDKVSLLNLCTHTSGGLPLQVPDNVANDDELMSYFRNWQPTYAPGTYRLYSNPSIGLLGMIAAKSMNGDFDGLVTRDLFQELGMAHAYFDVPSSESENYAQGYTQKDVPIRVAPGVLDAEAYGIKTTAADMLRFVAANMRMVALHDDLQRAVNDTHNGYYRIGPMTQDLIWEQYPYPVALEDLLAGNSDKISLEASPALQLDPPSPPRDDVLINKTGSTNGFGAYVAFVPEHKVGIVLLANKNYPIDARVTAADEILARLGEDALARHSSTGR